MSTFELIEKLKYTPLETAEAVSVTLIEDGGISEPGTEIRGLPRFFRVKIVARPGPRSNIRTEVWLPEEENWNGRFVGTGNGGIASLLYLGGLKEYLCAGYACAHTDLGTSAGVLSGFENDDVKDDYCRRATHLMTVNAKKLIRALYGRGPEYSYFTGGSTGGMQGYSEAQRYPEDYDGIYASVPSIINTVYHTYYLWNYVHLHDKERRPLFGHDDCLRLAALSAEYFQSLGDGEPGDTFVTDPYKGDDRIEGFLTFLKGRMELSDAQRDALRAVYEGPSDPVTGKKISAGLPMGGEHGMESFCGDGCPGVYLFLWAFGPDFDPYSFDFSSDFDAFAEKMGRYVNAVDPDLNAFRDRGGKLLAYSGTADTVVLYPETDLYYERAAEKVGGVGECMKFFRYFLLPGRAHGGGIGADRISSPGAHGGSAFDALVRWCEEGVAPDTLDAISSDDPGVPGKKPFERTIYPYGSEKFPFRAHPDTFSNR